MEILLLSVAIPSFGLLMVLCCRVLTTAGTVDTVERYQNFLRAICAGMVLSIAALIAIAVVDLITAAPNWNFDLLAWTVLRVTIVALLLLVVRYGWNVANAPVDISPSVTKAAIRSRQLKWLWLGSLFAMALPVMIFGLAPLLYLWLLSSFDFAYQNLIVKFRRARLLWTLASGTRFEKPLHLEVLQLAKSENDSQQGKLLKLAAALEEGIPLSQSLASVPGLLPIHLISTIAAAEKTPNLAQTLQALAREQSRRWSTDYSLEENIIGLMIYTVAFVSMYAVVVGFVMYYIIPKFKAILNDFGVESSSQMHLLLALSDLMRDYWFLFVVFLPLPLLGLLILTLTSSGYDGRYLTRFSALWPRLQAPLLLKSLSNAVRANARPDDVLSAYCYPGQPLLEHQRLERVQLRIASGETLGGALFDEGYLLRSELKAIEIAEERGHLAWGLDSIARRIEVARYNRSRWILESARPVVIVLLGLSTLIFCVAIFSTLAKLINDLS